MEGKSNCENELVKTHLNFSVENILKEGFQKRRAFAPADHSKSPKEAKFIGTFEGDTSSSNLASPLSPIVEASDNDIRADENNSEPETETQDSVQQSSPGYIKSPSGVTIELLGQDLWKKFYKLGTEMIITKAGRRMFPTLKVRVSGLRPKQFYAVLLQLTTFDDKRYRYVYHSSKWMVAGAGDPLPSSSLFVHGDSPCLGEMWSAQGSIVFDKFKLTNNRCTIIQGQTCLHSMHKYLPKVLVVPLSSDQIHMSSETLLRHFEEFGVPSNADEFVFPETAFITVTAYQNQQITKLKIDSNPFAKGFREATRTREPNNHLDLADPYFHSLMSMDLLHRHSPFLFNPFLNPLNPYSGLWIPPPPINEHPAEENS